MSSELGTLTSFGQVYVSWACTLQPAQSATSAHRCIVHLRRQMPDNLSVFSDMAVMVWLDARRCTMSEIVGQAVNVLLSSMYLCTVTGSVNWMLALYHCAIVGPMISLAISLMG